MLAQNKIGWILLEYIDIEEKDIEKYRNITGAYAILKIADKMLLATIDGETNGNFRQVELMKEKRQEKQPFENYMRKLIKKTNH